MDHSSLSEIAGVARNFGVGAGFGWDAMENDMFSAALSGVNTGPSKILVVFVLLWPPGFCPRVSCFSKLRWDGRWWLGGVGALLMAGMAVKYGNNTGSVLLCAV